MAGQCYVIRAYVAKHTYSSEEDEDAGNQFEGEHKGGEDGEGGGGRKGAAQGGEYDGPAPEPSKMIVLVAAGKKVFLTQKSLERVSAMTKPKLAKTLAEVGKRQDEEAMHPVAGSKESARTREPER
ncbi:hypothetical protein FRC07_003759 [Ceratobasidium sp. 392]|nr:hypothetical protein FRC07_003759 [Ceratobasidium sp. 392]